MPSIREIISTLKHPRDKQLREREALSASECDLLKRVEVAADYNPVQDWKYRRECAAPPYARDLRMFSVEQSELGTVTIGRGWYKLSDDESHEADEKTSYFLQVVDPSGKIPLLSLSDSAIAQRIFLSLSERLDFAQQSLCPNR